MGPSRVGAGAGGPCAQPGSFNPRLSGPCLPPVEAPSRISGSELPAALGVVRSGEQQRAA